MLTYSVKETLLMGETGIYFKEGEYNFMDPAVFLRFRVKKDKPVYFMHDRQLGCLYDRYDPLGSLKTAVRYAKEKGLKSIAVPCPSISLSDLKQLREDLEEEDLQIRLVFRRSHIQSLFGLHQYMIETSVKKDYQSPYIQYSKGTTLEKLREDYEKRQEQNRPSTQYSLSLEPSKDDKKLTKEELYEELRKASPSLQKSFSDMLFGMIREKGLDEVEVYKRANLTRKLFSKIRSSSDYRPSKATAVSLCIGMRLNIEETEALLNTLGISLSRSDLGDVIVRAFILNEIYDIDELNLFLLENHLKPLTNY